MNIHLECFHRWARLRGKLVVVRVVALLMANQKGLTEQGIEKALAGLSSLEEFSLAHHTRLAIPKALNLAKAQLALKKFVLPLGEHKCAH